MDVTVHIPDDIATRLLALGGDLPRLVLEGLALEEYKNGHITDPELCLLLGFETRYELDGFLKAHACTNISPWKISTAILPICKAQDSKSVRLVIADTGRVNYLILIGHIDLLPNFVWTSDFALRCANRAGR